MDVTLTIDDPKAYTRSWTVNASPSRLVVGQDLLEYVCTENNKDVEHLVGEGLNKSPCRGRPKACATRCPTPATWHPDRN